MVEEPYPCVLDILNDDDIDIVCLQETWFSKQDLGSLNMLHSNCHGPGAATIDYKDNLRKGHNPGVVSMLWRTPLDVHVTCLDLNIYWLTGIQITISNRTYVILCVYMPYESHANEDLFLENLGTINAVIEELDTTCISVLGDWNSDISDSESVFCKQFKQFCEENCWLLSSELLLPATTFTYLRQRWDSTSWLYHCVSTSGGHNVIQSIDVLFCTSDHIPICIDVSLELVPQVEGLLTHECKRIGWDRVSDDCINGNAEATKYNLKNVNIPHDAIICNNVNCTDDAHISAINLFYDNINESMNL